MAGKTSSDQCVPAVESRKRKAETEMRGNTQRSRPNGSSPSARSTEVLEEAGRSGVPKGAYSPRPDNPPCSQTGTAPPTWKDVLKLAIWRLLPPEHPGLSPTEVHDRLREQKHELLKHQYNLKSLQSAIYAALNEMMFVYVDRRRPKGSRVHQYIALQRMQEGGTQVKNHTASFKSSPQTEGTASPSQRSTSLGSQETKRSPEHRSSETQPATENPAVGQPPSDRGSKTQIALAAKTCPDNRSQGSDVFHASAKRVQPQGLTEGARTDWGKAQGHGSALSVIKESDGRNQPPVPAAALATNASTCPDTTSAMRDHAKSAKCATGRPNDTSVLQPPTVLPSNSDLPQERTVPASSYPIQRPSEQARAGPRPIQQASDQNSPLVKSSQTGDTLCQDHDKTVGGCEAESQVQVEYLGKPIVSPHSNGVASKQNKTSVDNRPIDQDHTGQMSHREHTDIGGDVKNTALIELGKQVERAHSLRLQRETYKREKMALQAKLQAKQATLAESVTRANEATVRFNELSSRHQRLQAQFSDSERELADARRQTSQSRDVARRKDAECQTHTALMAQLADDWTSTDRDYQNLLQSLGLE